MLRQRLLFPMRFAVRPRIHSEDSHTPSLLSLPRRERSLGTKPVFTQGVEERNPCHLDVLRCSTPLYVDDLEEESELGERQTGAPLGARSRLAARVAASPIALSPNGCKGKKSRIARRGKPR